MIHPLSPATRYLLLIGELHKIGFERLRFVAGGEQYMRVHAFAACNEGQTDAGWSVPELIFSSELFGNAMPKRQAARETLQRAWAERLAGELRPRHLVGQFVLDFPEFLQSAYGADQAYAHWFRRLVPYLLEGHQPRMYGNPYDNTPAGFFELAGVSEGGRFPDPPPNPFKIILSDGTATELRE